MHPFVFETLIPAAHARVSRSHSLMADESGSRKRTHSDMEAAGSDELPAATVDNPLQVPDAPPYRIIVAPAMTFDDVVATLDQDNIRKIAQIVLYEYRSPKTTKMYITYDNLDKAYEVSFALPHDAEVTLDALSKMYIVVKPFVTKNPWLQGAVSVNESGDIEYMQHLSMRVASYRRSHVRVTRTSLLIQECESMYVPSDGVFDSARPLKRAATGAAPHDAKK